MTEEYEMTPESSSPSRRFAPALPLLGRILIASLFLPSGFSKLSAPGPTIGYIASAGLPFPRVGLGVAIVIEIVFSILLVLGFFTRPVAVVLALFTLATAMFFHTNLSDQMQMVHFFKNIAIIGGLLQIVAFGPGHLSLDARRGNRVR